MHSQNQTNVPLMYDAEAAPRVSDPAAPPDFNDTSTSSQEAILKPTSTYGLRSQKPNLNTLVPYGPSDFMSYEIAYRSSTALSLFSRKSDMTLSRLPPSKNDRQNKEEAIARMDFHSDGPLPYYPRARVSFKHASGVDAARCEMQARDFKNWTFSHADNHYTWTFHELPYTFELSSASTPQDIIARFTYSANGTDAQPGGEIGTLELFAHVLSDSRDGREVIISGCLIAVQYAKGLGREYRNHPGGNQGPMSAGLRMAGQDEIARATMVGSMANWGV